MYLLAEVFPKRLSDETIELYDTALADIDPDDLQRAAQHIIRTREDTMFPTPAQIRSTYRAHVWSPERLLLLPEPKPSEDSKLWSSLWGQFARDAIGKGGVDFMADFYQSVIDAGYKAEWIRERVIEHGGDVSLLERLLANKQRKEAR